MLFRIPEAVIVALPYISLYMDVGNENEREFCCSGNILVEVFEYLKLLNFHSITFQLCHLVMELEFYADGHKHSL